ncbi:MAG: hypothetical protein KDD36_02200 [Flavobacteriales bacterium]|nr:hypothetical protein [Flavobacteriales bacterium]
MKKVLVISYFYPPCTLTAAQRTGAWVKYLEAYNWQPVVVTRCWPNAIHGPMDALRPCGNDIRFSREGKAEVFRLPYRPSFRDRYVVRHANRPWRVLSRLLTLWQMVCDHWLSPVGVMKDLQVQADKVIANDPDISAVIISGNPFEQFRIGYRLHRKHGIPWIADYRDDWNTSELEEAKTLTGRLLRMITSVNEKLWVGTASFITSVSPWYVEKIQQFTGVKGEVVLNGYDELPEMDNDHPPISPTEFIITYNGTLYESQDVETVLDVVKSLIDQTGDKLKIVIHFPGLAYDSVAENRVRKNMRGYEDHVVITDRIPRLKVLEIQQQSDVLLMIAHGGVKGVPSSKVFEYIGLRKPVLLYPNDHDILESLLTETNLGVICNNREQLENSMKEMILSKVRGEANTTRPDKAVIAGLSRKQQVEKLVHLLNRL